MLKGFIYITTNNITNKKYIGKKYYFYKNGKESNWKNYLGSSKLLKNDISHYGSKNFSREIIDEANTEEELAALEKFYIDSHNAVFSEEYYNLSNNVDKFYTTNDSITRMLNTRSNWSDEKRKLVSDKLKNRWSNLSDEQREIRINNMSKPRDDSFRKKRSNIQKKVWSEYSGDHKAEIANKRSKKNKLHWQSLTEEQKQSHVNVRKHALEKMHDTNRAKTKKWMQTRVALINLKDNTEKVMTIKDVIDFGIPYGIIRQLLNNCYSTHNRYKRKWTVVSI